MIDVFESLSAQLDGELYTDNMHLAMYATDASVYREYPKAVAFPKHSEDVKLLISTAATHNLPVIPRAAGTSLAGQVVGNGLVIDCSKYMTDILEVNEAERWVRVQPGVILDELNQHIKQFDLFFGPETSTSTHCTIGGMFGNNSCGTHSIIYGSVRQHIISADVVLANGEQARFTAQSKEDFLGETDKKGEIQNNLHALLKHPNVVKKIQDRFPPSHVIRRNTGYALDYLVNSSLFSTTDKNVNLCELLAGSEGTLAFTTEMKLNLVPLPPPHKAIVCLQHHNISQACEANLIALKNEPDAVELMDDIIINLARQNPIQKEQSQFIEGLPKAVLLVEFTAHTKERLQQKTEQFLQHIAATDLSHHETVLYNADVAKVWDLRKAGLGVLGNMVGDKKPVALVEDTAVAPEDLPTYVAEFEALMAKYDNECVFYAHISAGELHLRPILNLKDAKDRKTFRAIGEESAKLVAKYNGSISGEHGDGRLRGEFIPVQYGQEIYTLFQQVKDIFDPKGILNPGKIVDTPPMDEFLRYEANQETNEFDTVFDFSDDMGLLRAVEKCNGVGYCRKTEVIGGTMCPSFQATKNEKDSTRARANTLREFLSKPNVKDAFLDDEIFESLDLCLSCKACKSECPSGVDMAKLKAEATHQRHVKIGVPRRSKLIANNSEMIRKVKRFSGLVNPLVNSKLSKSVMGFAQARSIPKIQSIDLVKWHKNQRQQPHQHAIHLFIDEFTETLDVDIGKATIQLLETLGFEVKLITGLNSGRAHLSKGMLTQAKRHAEKNIGELADKVTTEQPLVGIEPSSILTFKDETLSLLRGEQREQAMAVAANTFTLQEFLVRQVEAGNVKPSQFKKTNRPIYIHGHCHEKALIGQSDLQTICSLVSHEVHLIPSGCCGMAGSFGYEKEHYEVSMQIGELVLLPAVRNMSNDAILVASGTSCRHQIKDGTGKRALHPAELLWQFVRE